MKPRLGIAAIAFALFCASPADAAEPEARDVLRTYADIAAAAYADSASTAKVLRRAVGELVAAPSAKTLEGARTAWRAARVPYQQTEAYRFGNAIVDDWEGKVNAWPLDEGLIDYVAATYGSESDENAYYAVNVIANPTLRVGGEELDASTIDADLLRSLHEIGDVEANVATGYHAIEFLLWGQDLNGTGPGAGERPYTDFDPANCTGSHCARRADYLSAAADLLVSDLEEMEANWAEGGAARAGLMNGEPGAGLATILTGMGSLSYGELAGERMKLGLLLHDPEEEHDCFSDTTTNSYYYDAVGIRNVYLGRYRGIDGSVVEGPSVSDLVAATAPDVDAELREKLDTSVGRFQALRDRAAAGEAYDQMIGEGNGEGNAAVQAAIDALIDQTRSIERAVAALELQPLTLEGSDSLDNANAVFQ